MPRAKKPPETSEFDAIPAPVSEEAEEDLNITLAANLARKQLVEGTASPSVITHYLKLGSSREKLEKEILKRQAVLMEAKTEAIKTSEKMEILYNEAIAAMRRYRGESEESDDGCDSNIFRIG